MSFPGQAVFFRSPAYPNTPQRVPGRFRLSQRAQPLAVCGRFGFSPRSGEKQVRRMPCTGLSRGPATSSTPEFGQVLDHWLQILWSETGKEIDRAIRFPLRITLRWSCLGGPPPLRSKFVNRCLQECHTGMDPEALQWSGSFPRTLDPRADREHRGPKRHYRRRLEPHVGEWGPGAAQEGQTEGAVASCRQRKTGADNRRRQASRKRFPFLKRFPKNKPPGNRAS